MIVKNDFHEHTHTQYKSNKSNTNTNHNVKKTYALELCDVGALWSVWQGQQTLKEKKGTEHAGTGHWTGTFESLLLFLHDPASIESCWIVYLHLVWT